MKLKQIVILGVIFGLLTLGVVVKSLQKPAELATEEYQLLDLSFDLEAVSHIDLSKPKTDGEADEEYYTELKKQDGQWQVPSLWNARGDEKKIEGFLEEIKSAKGELRSSDPKLLGDFGLEDKEAFGVKLHDASGAELLSFRMGTVKSDFRYLFVRREGSDKVYLTDANLFGRMGIYGEPKESTLESNYWASMTMTEFDVETVEGLEAFKYFEGVETRVAHVIKETDAEEATKKKWSYVRSGLPFPLDASKVKNFLRSLQNWRAQKVLSPESEYPELDNPELKLKLTLEGGREIVITGGSQIEDKGAHPMRISSEPVLYQLTGHYVENMYIDDSKFFISNPYGVDPEKTKFLKVKAGSKKKEWTLSPEQDSWEGLTAYLNDVKNLHIPRLIFEPSERKRVEPPERYFIEIQKQGEETSKFLDVGGSIADDREYAATRRNDTQAFAINTSYFRRLFEDTDRLNKPAEETETS